MKNKPDFTFFECLVLGVVLLIVLVGITSFYVNRDWFLSEYVVEDGFIEYITLIPLLVAAGTALVYRNRFSDAKSRYFKMLMVMVFASCLFVAGEEISWGQRLFNVQSSEFFLQNNVQAETNLHNMQIGDVKINKLVFSKMLYLMVGIYLTAVPYLYQKNASFKKFMDFHGIPVPQLYQTMSCALLFVSISLIPHGKNAEILEVGICHLFLLIFLFPQNKHIFRVPTRTAVLV